MPFFNSEIANFHYHKYGVGKEVMLGFHGFGMRGNQFRVLEEALGQKYTIYSFDLFFHGETIILDASRKAIKKSINKSLFAKEILRFLQSINAAENKFALLSYSIGSKLALSLINEIPEKILEAYFVAPDGIDPNQLLETGAKNKVLNYIFWWLVYSPKTVMFSLNSLKKLKYIDHSLHHILEKEFITQETRLACYNTITYFAELSLNKENLKKIINQNNITTHFYFGKKDGLFPPKIGERFCKDLKNSSLHIIDDGHDLINQNLNVLMKSHV
jgi:pimeloyl-ACP methyl ester carboxylesterase